MPKWIGIACGVVVRIEGIDAVMLGRDEEHIVHALAGNGHVSEDQRLAVNLAIHGIGKSGKDRAPRRNQARLERPLSAAYFAVKRPANNATARTPGRLVLRFIVRSFGGPFDASSS